MIGSGVKVSQGTFFFFFRFLPPYRLFVYFLTQSCESLARVWQGASSRQRGLRYRSTSRRGNSGYPATCLALRDSRKCCEMSRFAAVAWVWRGVRPAFACRCATALAGGESLAAVLRGSREPFRLRVSFAPRE